MDNDIGGVLREKGTVNLVTVVAKACGSEEAPENTLEAIQNATSTVLPPWARLAIEVDLRLTADGNFVAFHDATLERTTNGRGAVRSQSVSALKRLRAGPRGEQVPTLDEVLEANFGGDLVLDVHEASDEAIRRLIEKLLRLQRQVTDRIVVASEHARLMHQVRSAAPRLRTAATPGEAWEKLVFGWLGAGRFARSDCIYMVPVTHCGLNVVTQRFVGGPTAPPADVWAYGLREPDEVIELRSLGVSGCFTSSPRAWGAAMGA